MTDDRTSYDDVPYPSGPFRHTHPDRMEVLAALSGLDPVPPSRARVLELACAAGGNLIPMAAALPEARFVGVDLSRVQIEEGQETIRALGLTNIELRHADLSQLDASLGSFDYVIAHGVYSWVSRPVQDALLACLRARLSAQGVAYVSYNTYPGWRMRGMIRDLMLYHTRQFEDPPTKVDQARRLLDYLAREVSAQQAQYAVILRSELELLKKASDAYLFHEHLEEHNEPLYFHELAARAESAGLRVFGEAQAIDRTPYLFPARTQRDLVRGSDDWIKVEQYRDFVLNRTFRSSLLCHAERALKHTPGPADVVRRRVASWAAPVVDVDLSPNVLAEFQLDRERISLERSLSKAAFLELQSRWPESVAFDELVTRARERLSQAGLDPATLPPVEVDPQGFAAELLELFTRSLVELPLEPSQLAAQPPERPRTSSLVRLQAERGENEVTTLRHLRHEVINLDRQLLKLLDGTRDVPALARALARAAVDGHLEVLREAQPVTDRADLEAIFLEVVPPRLTDLARHALLLR